ncbi:unnamed protein product (macronuclear) [Paramecium tetraurelia]|uniref:Actin5-3 (Actin-related protein 1-3) n=1 Tax=Paramecium tetraurelia TaxID=5888 RepID=Q3M0X9_PARTE|nr:uncharacterized protein GSPATT00005796001 [Paramecium tetraurelia]CAH69672.1 actin5-3 (actin-related protein 1-3) [Paramecium tetraurelia]CAK62550.1 unnamed protein product [Paramecium tetraurelia]|eukprot:XP_001429948.1 hypothetical protein (macronuclear) [Paramecium tetraurelia strain d4-2]
MDRNIFANNPMIIDMGSSQIKAGFGGEDKPKVIFNSYIGRPKVKALSATNSQELYVGNQITDSIRGNMKIKYPYQKGIIKDMNDMDQLWKYTFQELHSNPKECPILLTEPSFSSQIQKMEIAKQFFENYDCPALFFAVSGIVSLFASGKTTGVILDVGDTVSQSIPIYDGFYIQHSAQRVDLAGRDVTDNLNNLLRRSGYIFTKSAELEIIKKIKEKRCFLSPTMIAEEKFQEERKIKDQYMLPDNNTIEISYEKQRAPEILMSPEKYGLELNSIPEILANSIQKVDLDLRKSLYNEIVLTGGTSLMQGFPERLIGEVKRLIPKDAKVKIWAPPERITLCWQGGSILSKLASFKSMWILKKEFEDEGERILIKKQL